MGFCRDYLLDILLMSVQLVLWTAMISGWNNHDRREREKKEPESTIPTPFPWLDLIGSPENATSNEKAISFRARPTCLPR